MHCEQAHLTKNRRQILFRSLGVRNKSNTVVFICAVFSSSCMVTLKPFNNSKHISFANIVRGIVVSIGSQKDRNDVFPFFLRVCPKSLQLCLILCYPMDCSRVIHGGFLCFRKLLLQQACSHVTVYNVLLLWI